MYAANAATNVRNQRRIDYTQPAPQPLHATSAVTTVRNQHRNQCHNHCMQLAYCKLSKQSIIFYNLQGNK